MCYRLSHIILFYVLTASNIIYFSECYIINLYKRDYNAIRTGNFFSKRKESTPVSDVILSGLQPSGKLHLGNYFGCIYPCLKAQEMNERVNFMIANLHSITSIKCLPEIPSEPFSYSLSKQALALGLACGLDPSEGTKFFYQSQVNNILKLNWIITCLISAGRIQGLVRLRNVKNTSFGLICYPVLMSSDILSIKANRIIANKDQSPHVELARYVAKKLNNFIGYEFFPLPEIDTSQSSSIMSLSKPTEKMSKYEIDDDSKINLLDSPDVIYSKIKGAVTDSLQGLSIEPEKRPGIANLIKIYSKCSGIAQDKAVCDFSDSGFIEFKKSVAEVVIEFLRPIQERYNEIINDHDYLDQVTNEGLEHINSLSKQVTKVFDCMY